MEFELVDTVIEEQKFYCTFARKGNGTLEITKCPWLKTSKQVSNTSLTLASNSNSICQQQQRNKTPSVTPIIQWPGIEAVIESYKKYSQGNNNNNNTQISFFNFPEVAIRYLINIDLGQSDLGHNLRLTKS